MKAEGTAPAPTPTDNLEKVACMLQQQFSTFTSDALAIKMIREHLPSSQQVWNTLTCFYIAGSKLPAAPTRYTDVCMCT